ncbi:MAG TPA: hypothetical protein VK968_06080 [Roseimicrobium sp.]|nr:hypothetical protein [Roseimicrobium sp.]
MSSPPKEANAPRTGYFESSFRSSVDGSEQPFMLWVPPGYSPRKTYPLMVVLHGSDADHRMIPEWCLRIHERGFRDDMILLSPFCRGDVDYRWMGETDLWESMAKVKALYRIDARRQYLTGLSLGGYATWSFGMLYPEQWAAIAPVCGGGDVSSVAHLKNVPVWCVHGAGDNVVPVEQSRRLIREMQRLKLPHRYDELPDGGHNVWDRFYNPDRSSKDSLASWFLKHRKTRPAPARTAPDRSGQWLDVLGERVIISYPGETPIPKESDMLRSEAHRLAAFHFGDIAMRSGKLMVKADLELSKEDLSGSGHIMLGRSDNHRCLKSMERKLTARHTKGKLTVGTETYLGKSLLAATLQPSPWNKERLLAVITYQQFRQVPAFLERVVTSPDPALRINLYDSQQKRFLRREP